MEAQFEAEVREFHVALEDWFSGRLPREPDAYAALTDVIPDDFVLISPRGAVGEGRKLMDQIEGAHGVQSGVPFAIRIENCRLRVAEGGYCLGTYEEWQTRDGATTARLSTVLFRANPALRHGLEWLHLHETWLEGQAPAD
jgi:hypothetical protein